MDLEKGKDEFSHMTFDCDNKYCSYHKNGRCIYNVARIKIRTSKACYEELRSVEIEAELDYMDGI